jgi:hypothetical protein
MTMYRLAFVMRVYASFLCNLQIKISSQALDCLWN